MRPGQRVRTRGRVTVWVLTETVLDGMYLVEDVRPGLVKVVGVWVPLWCVEGVA